MKPPSGPAGVLAALLFLACSEAGTGPTPVEDDLLPPGAVVDEFDSWDPTRWEAMDHVLGRGMVRATNLRPAVGLVQLRLPATSFDGAELRSMQRLRHGMVEGRIRASSAPGSLTAFFLYEGAGRRNDEVDLEILGGTRTAYLTVWEEDQQVFHTSVTLPFDPSLSFHDYRITWSADRVEWRADGALLATAQGLSLGTELHLYVNAWWPTWLEGGPAATEASALVERLVT